MLGLGGFRPPREDCGLHLDAENEQNRIGVEIGQRQHYAA